MTTDEVEISCDKDRLDIEAIHAFLEHSYWSPGISIDIVRRSISNSLCFGVYHGSRQIGFARVVTDQATFAYLADVYLLETYRGRGFAKKLLQFVMAHPDLQGLRRFMLATRDAHSLYRRFGFDSVMNPERLMEILRPGIYQES